MIRGRANTPMYSGIITNYICTAACRHCMFSSYRYSKSLRGVGGMRDFITREKAGELAEKLSAAGVDSVHIGGGEPFINFAALCGLIEALGKRGIGIDYIETNAFWAVKESFVRRRLRRLRKLGVTTVMPSVDPFHIEFVPLGRVLLLCKLLREEGLDYFIWQERYLRRLYKLDHGRTYSHEELCEILGDDYVAATAREYGIGMNGRALEIAEEIYPKRTAEAFIKDGETCNLLSPRHCHIDLYGNVVPSGCPGLALPLDEFLAARADRGRYPAFARLLGGGIGALYEYAAGLGFTPDGGGYATKCALCFNIRAWLNENHPSPDIAPGCFYIAMKDNKTGGKTDETL